MLTLQLNNWLNFVYKPAQYCMDHDLYEAKESGDFPVLKTKKVKTIFDSEKLGLHLLPTLPPSYHWVKYFDIDAPEYDMATGAFRKAIFIEVCKTIRPLIGPNSVLLEACCGTGTEAIHLSEMAVHGKVIAVDLSVEMINLAFQKAKLAQTRNVVFYQQDLLQLPSRWKNQFHVSYCQLSLSYLSSWQHALEQIFEATMTGGIFISVEANDNWYNQAAAPLVKASNPAFQQQIEESKLRAALIKTGFSSLFQKEILPGINLIMASK
jgi:ubiquinone/menaquinone biosynthesis C-methylase UbiE